MYTKVEAIVDYEAELNHFKALKENGINVIHQDTMEIMNSEHEFILIDEVIEFWAKKLEQIIALPTNDADEFNY